MLWEAGYDLAFEAEAPPLPLASKVLAIRIYDT